MAECLVTGVVKDLTGAVVANGTVTFTRLGGVISFDGSVRVPELVTVSTGSGGELSVTLVTGNYLMAFQSPSGRYVVRIGVPDSPAADIVDLFDVPITVVEPIVQQARDYRDEAEAASTAAGISASLAAAAAATAPPQYATRAAFVAANTATPGLGLSDGRVVTAAGVSYRCAAGAAAISDLAGWVINEPSADLDAMQIAVTSDHQPYETVAQRALLPVLLADIRAIGAQATFHLGDIVHLGDMAEVPEETLDGVTFDDYMEALHASGQNLQTFFPIAGNHDMESYLSASPNTRGTGVEFYNRFRRPPVYAVTNGNMAYIFCGYENFRSVEQINSNLIMDALEDLLKQFQDSHNVFVFTHAPLYEAGLFDFNPATEWFRLKPQARWLSIFNTYKIDAHFCGHSATDIITADETTVKTYATRTGSHGYTTHHILTGPHMEQRHWNAGHRLGGRVMVLQRGASSVTVRMRDHDNATWIDAKQISVPVRFPIRLHSDFEDHSTKLQGPVMRGPLRVVTGVGDRNSTGTTTVDSLRVGGVFEWEETFAGDVPVSAEYMLRVTGPADELTTTGPSVMFGVRKLNETDTNLLGGFSIYATDAAGADQLVVAQNSIGQFLFRGSNYPVASLLPMWDAQYTGAAIPGTSSTDPMTITYSTETYDDFNMLNAATGVLTCTQQGVYEVRGFVQINGAAGAFEDIVSVRFKRVRSGVTTYFGARDYTLQAANANTRQILSAESKIGLLSSDTLEMELVGWANTNPNTLVRATFSGYILRGV